MSRVSLEPPLERPPLPRLRSGRVGGPKAVVESPAKPPWQKSREHHAADKPLEDGRRRRHRRHCPVEESRWSREPLRSPGAAEPVRLASRKRPSAVESPDTSCWEGGHSKRRAPSFSRSTSSTTVPRDPSVSENSRDAFGQTSLRPGDSREEARLKDEVVRIYRDFNPGKLHRIDDLFYKYQGMQKLRALLAALKEKYLSGHPQPETPAEPQMSQEAAEKTCKAKSSARPPKKTSVQDMQDRLQKLKSFAHEPSAPRPSSGQAQQSRKQTVATVISAKQDNAATSNAVSIANDCDYSSYTSYSSSEDEGDAPHNAATIFEADKNNAARSDTQTEAAEVAAEVGFPPGQWLAPPVDQEYSHLGGASGYGSMRPPVRQEYNHLAGVSGYGSMQPRPGQEYSHLAGASGYGSMRPPARQEYSHPAGASGYGSMHGPIKYPAQSPFSVGAQSPFSVGASTQESVPWWPQPTRISSSTTGVTAWSTE